MSTPEKPQPADEDKPDPKSTRDAQEQAAATEAHRVRHWTRDTPS